jgi:hypothetical protein
MTAMIVGSASVTYEPSVLQGRGGLPNEDETTTRLGLALTYVARKNFTISATYDYDKVSSDLPNREQERTRFGLNGRLYF